MKFILINADDFGYCPKRDKAIVDLFKRKSISSTSLLVNGDNAYQACLYAKQYNLPMGIHINLTEGRPITNDFIRIQSLVDSDGIMHGKFGLRSKLDQGSIQQEHVEYEIINQLNKYKELTNGQLPKHIDGHQHIHVHPMIVEIIARLARDYGIIYIRTPYDQMILNLNIDNLFYQTTVSQTQQAKKIFDKYLLKYSDYFFGMTISGKQCTLNNIEECLKLLKNDKKENLLIELMCHPGYPSDPYCGGCGTGQPDQFSQSIDRQYEFDILSSIEIKNLFEKYNIHLCIYDEIMKKKNLINTDMLNDDEVNVDANRCV